MTPNLQPLLDAAAKATHGEWQSYMEHEGSYQGYAVTDSSGLFLLTSGTSNIDGHNCDFAALARNSIPEIQRLVSLELRLREYVGELKAECADKGIAQPIAAAIRREIADRLESLMEGKP